MRSIQKAAWACAALLLVVGFQNCTAHDFSSNQNSSNAVDSSGQPYDGKVYVQLGSCEDGTQVKSRIALKSKTSGWILRENCQSISPRELDPAKLTLYPLDFEKLTYDNLAFDLEKPAAPVPAKASWYYQLSGPLPVHTVAVYVIDLFDSDAARIQSLKSAGRIVICSISAGTVAEWEPDAPDFAASDKGNQVAGSPNERWLDTRSLAVRARILARLDLAKSKGCNGIDLDNVDGHSNSSGFPLGQATQIDFNRYLAFAAHDRRLTVGMSNASDLIPSLAEAFDFGISQECFRFNECGSYQPFVAAGKPVLAAEYTTFSAAQCSEANRMSLSLAYFDPNLNGSRFEPCP